MVARLHFKLVKELFPSFTYVTKLGTDRNNFNFIRIQKYDTFQRKKNYKRLTLALPGVGMWVIGGKT